MRVSLRHVLVALATSVAIAVPIAAPAAEGVSVAAGAKTIPVPATRAFTSAIDPYAEYNGQTLCDPVVKPGLTKLANLIRETYGSYSIGVVRSCNDGGVSEHKEGRAMDIMWTKRIPAQKKIAKTFLRWLLAPDQFGNPAAMARRLGVMYIGWNNRIWRAYDPGLGWDDLKGCTETKAMKSRSYDTYCHRDHIHLSFSWDGAEGTTSFWTGRPVTVPDCDRRTSPVSRPAGTAADPAVLLDTATGVGTAAGIRCRLGADRWAGDDRALRVSVPVPPAGQGLRVRVERYDSNAPGTLSVDTSATGPWGVAATGTFPVEKVLPVGADGRLTVTTNAGEGYVRLVGLGYAPLPAAATPPDGSAPSTTGSPRSTLRLPKKKVTSGANFYLKGKVKNAPAGATVQRYLKVGTTFQPRGSVVVPATGAKRKWRMLVTALSTPTPLTYRIAVISGGTVVGWSKAKTVPVS